MLYKLCGLLPHDRIKTGSPDYRDGFSDRLRYLFRRHVADAVPPKHGFKSLVQCPSHSFKMAVAILAGFKARGTSIPAVCGWSEATQFQAQVTSNAEAGQKSRSPKGRPIFGTFRRCSSFTLLKQCAIVTPRTVLKSGPSIVKLWLGHYTCVLGII